MIEQIYEKCLKEKPNKKDNVWLILEYDNKNDLYRPKIILEDGRTKIDGKKNYIGNWQKKGQPNGGGDFWLSEGIGKLGLDEDFYDTTKLDSEIEKVIRDFCSKDVDKEKLGTESTNTIPTNTTVTDVNSVTDVTDVTDVKNLPVTSVPVTVSLRGAFSQILQST